jgi:hypothetical protein
MPAQPPSLLVKALEVSQAHKARSLELRATADLARLWADATSDAGPATCCADLQLFHLRLRHT